MPYHSKITCFIALCFAAQATSAQDPFSKAVRLSDEFQLPTAHINSIRLGNDGFLWIGTGNGLVRFDGQAYRTYNHRNNDSVSLLDDRILSVLPLEDETWTGTTKGISVLQHKTQQFRHYQLKKTGKSASVSPGDDNAIYILYLDRRQNIWAGTRSLGCWKYNREKDEFISFNDDSHYKPIMPILADHRRVLSIIASNLNDSIIWAGTAAGLQQINQFSGECRWYTFPQTDKEYQVAMNAFRRLYMHDNGLIYTGSWFAGVHIFDPATGSIRKLPLRNGRGADMLKVPISHIQRKSRTEIYFTTLAGLVLYDTDKESITATWQNDPLRDAYYGVEFMDSLERAWLRTIRGIYYFDPLQQQFPTYSYDHVYPKEWSFAFYIDSEPDDDMITVCPRVANGMLHFNRKGNQWQHIPFKKNALVKEGRITVKGFAKLYKNKYLLSAEEGLFIYTRGYGNLVRYLPEPSTRFRQWGDVLVDKKSTLWIAAGSDGIIRVDQPTGTIKIYSESFRTAPGAPLENPGKLFEDSRGNIWFSRTNGLGVHLSARDTIIQFLYHRDKRNSFPNVNSFAEDADGRVWMTGGDEWIGYASANEPQRGVIKKINLADHQFKGELAHLATDKNGSVWGYNQFRLFRIVDEGRQFDSFSFQYGIPFPDFFHFSFLSSGEMIFGGRNSITIANPSTFRRNTELPEPYIETFRLLNKQNDTIILNNTEQLSLKHNQNFFSVAFSAKGFTLPKQIRLRYRLSGFDDWNDAGMNRVATYTNVPPGKYTFQLMAANNEGNWNEKFFQLPVHIITPWWLTWWFRILTLLASAGAIWAFYRYRLTQVRKKEQMKSQYEKKLANVEMTALLSQMNPHFLFNSLNSIDSYIIRNDPRKASEYLNNFARLMRLILQHSRSNYISLKDELESLGLYLQMEAIRFGNKFRYRITVDENLDPANVLIPPMLIQPYVENAIWHGLMHKSDDEPGTVELIISGRNGMLYCSIQDNGIGRDKAAEIRAQKPGNRKRSMGMQITMDRIELINKLYNTQTNVEVTDLRDEEGNGIGTRVDLSIPI